MKQGCLADQTLSLLRSDPVASENRPSEKKIRPPRFFFFSFARISDFFAFNHRGAGFGRTRRGRFPEMRAAFSTWLRSGRKLHRPTDASLPIVGVMGVVPRVLRTVPKAPVAPATSRLADDFWVTKNPSARLAGDFRVTKNRSARLADDFWVTINWSASLADDFWVTINWSVRLADDFWVTENQSASLADDFWVTGNPPPTPAHETDQME